MIWTKYKDELEAMWEFFEREDICIAGGAVRDGLLGKDIKDLDIYWHPHNIDEAVIGSWWDKKYYEFFMDVFKTKPKKISLTSHDYEDTISVYYVKEDIQLILPKKNTTEYILHHFDVGLCKCWFHPRTGVVRSSEFIKDASNKTLTITEGLSEYQKDRTAKNHMPRMMEKYPEYDVVFPADWSISVSK